VYLVGLRCVRCSRTYGAGEAEYLCADCGAPAGDDPGILDARYDYDAAAPALRTALAGARRDIFRWLPLLPLDEPAPVPFTGGTPLTEAPRLAAQLGLARLWLKDEPRNPTRCLKDRATAIAIGRAVAAGRRELYCASAGNAAISLAGLAAHAGLTAHVYVPADASATRLAWLRHFGARVHVSSGDYDAAFDEAEAAGAAGGWYSRNCAFNPFLVEGKKTAAFEIAEQLRWEPPDLVAAPVGDGCTLAALGKGFRELRRVGLTERHPRLIGAQAEGMRPLVRRFRGEPPATESGDTRAASIKVRAPRNALRLLAEVAASDGLLTAVPDDAAGRAQAALGRGAGMVAEFTSAAALAALASLPRHEREGRTAVVVITGGRPDEL
jgi:threonine synthase